MRHISNTFKVGAIFWQALPNSVGNPGESSRGCQYLGPIHEAPTKFFL
jgi:hypothetical protein